MRSAAIAPSPWIVSRSQDLVWFQGSVVAGLALLIFFVLGPPLDDAGYTITNPAMLAVLLWGVLFDGPHVWGTYARTYAAPDTASRAQLPGAWSWALLGVGPAVALVDAVIGAWIDDVVPLRLFPWFLLGAFLWAYWHLVRQHYGFLMLYRRRAADHDRDGARLDSLILWTGCLYPYIRFALTDRYAATGLPQLLPAGMVAPARLVLDVGFGMAMAALVALALSGRVEPFRAGPRHLLLAIVIAFHVLVFASLGSLLAILATLTIFHNLQYHRIVWQYERGLGRTPSGGLLPYLGLGVALGLAWYVPRVIGVALAGDTLVRNVLIGLGWGVAFHHYLVDGRIWRVRRTPAVSRALDQDSRTAEMAPGALSEGHYAPLAVSQPESSDTARGLLGAARRHDSFAGPEVA